MLGLPVSAFTHHQSSHFLSAEQAQKKIPSLAVQLIVNAHENLNIVCHRESCSRLYTSSSDPSDTCCVSPALGGATATHGLLTRSVIT